MRIGLEHIDPKIAAAMRDRLCAPGITFLKDNIRWVETEETSLIRLFLNQALRRPEQRQPEEAERLAQLVHHQRERMTRQRAAITVAASLVGAGLIGMLFLQLVGGSLWVGGGVALVVGITGLVVGGIWTWNATSSHELYYEVALAEFHAVVPLLTLTELEAAYCDLLTRVCDKDPNQEARRAVRRHIVRIKEFVSLGRQLEALADASRQTGDTAFQERIEIAQEDLVEAVDEIADALCAILVVPSPAGDRASERIETELQTHRKAVEELAAQASSVQPMDRKRRREKVS
jgi:hypothetical protein